MLKYEVSLCYTGGFLGWLVLVFTIGIPYIIWGGLAWLSWVTWDVYWTLLSLGSAQVIATQYLVSTLWFDKMQKSPDSTCNNNIRALPDLLVWLTAHYIVVMFAHDFAVRRPLRLWMVLQRAAALAVVIVVLVLMHNTTVAYAFVGVGFGVATGVLFSVLLLVVWVPRMCVVNDLLLEWRHCLREVADSHLSSA
jgi:hypothetical protein